MKISRTKEPKNNNNVNSTEKLIEYFFSTENTKFIHLLKLTKKWEELYESTESLLAVVISIIISIIWIYLFNTIDINVFNDIIREVSTNIFAALIGMLGFIISGLAILTGTITERVIDLIDKKGIVTSLISILYSFYFIGAFIGVSILLFITMYLLSFPDIVATNFSVAFISFSLSYMFCFSVIYSIALLGTCLRIFLVSYKFIKDDREEKSGIL